MAAVRQSVRFLLTLIASWAICAAAGPLANAADAPAAAMPRQLAAGSAGGWLLMGIFLQLLVAVLPALLLHRRKQASARFKVLICLSGCAAMAAR